jgi:hypothetical protein
MNSAGSSLSRRQFMLLSAAGVAVSLLTDLLGLVPKAKGSEEAKPARKDNADRADPKCRGCQVCTIFYSNCLTLNNRLCWCETAKIDQSGAQT